MTQDEKVKHWIDLADSDVSAAETLMKNKHNLHAGFMCQQAVEKIIKGYFIKVRNEVHPHIHDLTKLVKLAELHDLLNDEQISFIKKLNPLYIEARYSEYKMRIAESLTDDIILKTLTQTKEFVLWTKEIMQS